MAADHLKKIDRPVTFLPKNQFTICNLKFAILKSIALRSHFHYRSNARFAVTPF
jgi:hypothetical protein